MCEKMMDTSKRQNRFFYRLELLAQSFDNACYSRPFNINKGHKMREGAVFIKLWV